MRSFEVIGESELNFAGVSERRWDALGALRVLLIKTARQ